MRMVVNGKQCQIKFRHVRFSQPRRMLIPTRYDPQKRKERWVWGQTSCFLYVEDKKIARSASWCGTGDIWNYETGRRTALRHLLEEWLLERDERTAIWLQYHERMAAGDTRSTMTKEHINGRAAEEKQVSAEQVGASAGETAAVSGTSDGSGVHSQQAESDSPAQWRYRC